MKVTEEEMDAVINDCVESEENGESRGPGMTYAQGVKAALQWVQGWGEHPLID